MKGVLTGSRHILPNYCRPVVLPAFTLRRSTTLPTTGSLPPLQPSTAPLDAIPSQQLIPVTSQLYLGTLGSLSDPLLLQQATIRHAIVISSCEGDEGLTPKDGGLPVLEDLLQWLLTDSERARGLAVCTAGGIPCKMVPVQLADEVGPSLLPTCLSFSTMVEGAAIRQCCAGAAVLAYCTSAMLLSTHCGTTFYHAEQDKHCSVLYAVAGWCQRIGKCVVL